MARQIYAGSKRYCCDACHGPESLVKARDGLARKLRTSVQITALIGLLAASTATAEEAQWSYAGKTGPEHWGELTEAFERCGDGRNQSPINLTEMVEAELGSVTFDYGTGIQSVVNNGHTIKAQIGPGAEMTVNGHPFALKQFHFHAPSEHQLQGEHFAMEGHFVHADEDGHLAVVTVLFQEGDASPALGQLWQAMPMEAGAERTLEHAQSFRPGNLLPEDKAYYRYNGSLTTPPCSEGVLWLVLKEPVTVSGSQVGLFRKAMGNNDTNRPVQPLNARAVLE